MTTFPHVFPRANVRWLSDDYYTQERAPTLDEVLKFETLASLFYVLLVGFAVALVVFGAEQLVALVRMRIGRKRERKMIRKRLGFRKGKKKKNS